MRIIGKISENSDRLIYRKNVYFGTDSVLKLEYEGGKNDIVDTDFDFIMVMYANFLDFIIGDYVLSHYETNTGIPAVLENTSQRLLGRVKILELLLDRIKFVYLDATYYSKLRKLLREITNLLLQNKKTEAYYLLLNFAIKTKTYNYFVNIYNKLLSKKQIAYKLE